MYQPRGLHWEKLNAQGLEYHPQPVLKTEDTVFPNMDRPKQTTFFFLTSLNSSQNNLNELEL